MAVKRIQPPGNGSATQKWQAMTTLRPAAAAGTRFCTFYTALEGKGSGDGVEFINEHRLSSGSNWPNAEAEGMLPGSSPGRE